MSWKGFVGSCLILAIATTLMSATLISHVHADMWISPSPVVGDNVLARVQTSASTAHHATFRWSLYGTIKRLQSGVGVSDGETSDSCVVDEAGEWFVYAWIYDVNDIEVDASFGARVVKVAVPATISFSPPAPAVGQTVTATVTTTVSSGSAGFAWVGAGKFKGTVSYSFSGGTVSDTCVADEAGFWTVDVIIQDTYHTAVDGVLGHFNVTESVPEFPLGVMPIFIIALASTFLYLRRKQVSQT